MLVCAVAFLAWRQLKPDDSLRGIASGNGRIEAVEVDVATKVAGRLDQLLVDEGDFASRGHPLARIDMSALDAQVRQAEAQSQQALGVVASARSQLVQRESEQRAAEAAVQQRVAEYKTVDMQFGRSAALAKKGYVSSQALDDLRARRDSTKSAVDAARAQVSAVAAAVASARTQVDAAVSAC